jgi:hypothetical protein
VRVGKLVQDYLSVQEMQLLGADAMNDAIEMYVDKEDTHAISKYDLISPSLHRSYIILKFRQAVRKTVA